MGWGAVSDRTAGDPAGLKLVRTPIEHLAILQGWFPDRDSAFRWGGPGLRFPFRDAQFLEDIAWGDMPTWSLVDAGGGLLGFGQYYRNHGRCHLARLAVAPRHRSRGLGHRLVSELIRVGTDELGLGECSLFVLADNRPAIRCYRSLGFEPREFPEWQDYFADVRFMVRPA